MITIYMVILNMTMRSENESGKTIFRYGIYSGFIKQE